MVGGLELNRGRMRKEEREERVNGRLPWGAGKATNLGLAFVG